MNTTTNDNAADRNGGGTTDPTSEIPSHGAAGILFDANPFIRNDSYSSIESGSSDSTLVTIHRSGSAHNNDDEQDEKAAVIEPARRPSSNRTRHGSYAHRLDEDYGDANGRLLPFSSSSSSTTKGASSWWGRNPILGNLASSGRARRHQTIPLALSAMAPSSSSSSTYRAYRLADDYDAHSSGSGSSSCGDEHQHHGGDADAHAHAVESNCHHCGSIVDGLESAASAASLHHRRHNQRPRSLLSRLPSGRSSNHHRRRNSSRGSNRSSRRQREADEAEHILSARQSLWDLFFILVPTIAACTLSFALGVSFEMLRSSILAAKGGHGHGYSRGGDWRAGGGAPSHHPHRWRPTSSVSPQEVGGAAGAKWIDVSEQAMSQGVGKGSATAGCSAMDLALARLTPSQPIRLHSHVSVTSLLFLKTPPDFSLICSIAERRNARQALDGSTFLRCIIHRSGRMAHADLAYALRRPRARNTHGERYTRSAVH